MWLLVCAIDSKKSNYPAADGTFLGSTITIFRTILPCNDMFSIPMAPYSYGILDPPLLGITPC